MSKRRRRQQSETPNLLTQLGAALGALWRLLTGSDKSKLDSDALKAKFDEIEQMLATNDAIHATQAIIQADAFLDGIMKQVGGQGNTFADRLRSLESRFSRTLYQQVWDSHKLRNRIAHEHVQVSVSDARLHLKTFRAAASALGAF